MSAISDPISDMLTRMRNAAAALHPEVVVPCSKQKVALVELFKREGYVQDFRIEGEGVHKNLRIGLKYRHKKPVIVGLRRISRPARRIYAGVGDIPRILGGMGTVVLSTPTGLVTDREARQKNVGGEILCYIW